MLFEARLVEQDLLYEQDLWNQHTLRTTHPGSVHQNVSDIWLRFNDLNQSLEDIQNDLECQNYPAITDAYWNS